MPVSSIEEYVEVIVEVHRLFPQRRLCRFTRSRAKISKLLRAIQVLLVLWGRIIRTLSIRLEFVANQREYCMRLECACARIYEILHTELFKLAIKIRRSSSYLIKKYIASLSMLISIISVSRIVSLLNAMEFNNCIEIISANQERPRE